MDWVLVFLAWCAMTEDQVYAPISFTDMRIVSEYQSAFDCERNKGYYVHNQGERRAFPLKVHHRLCMRKQDFKRLEKPKPDRKSPCCCGKPAYGW